MQLPGSISFRVGNVLEVEARGFVFEVGAYMCNLSVA